MEEGVENWYELWVVVVDNTATMPQKLTKEENEAKGRRP